MQCRLINGTEISAGIKEEVRSEVKSMAGRGLRPGLAFVLVGDNPSSRVYVRMKNRACDELGIYSITRALSGNATERELLDVIASLNNDPRIHGILVQLPLPDHLDETAIIDSIDPSKDVDGFHPVNMGRLLEGRSLLKPCTPHGIQVLLQRSGIKVEGRHVVIIGRSNIVGRPLANLLLLKEEGANATVTVCHSRTPDIAHFTSQADILVVAIGRPRFVTADMIRPGAVVVDVGVNRVEDPSSEKGYRLVGDVDFESVRDVASAITPVPGGVGPMTIAMLMKNTLTAAKSAPLNG